jgi:hypothetical protein
MTATLTYNGGEYFLIERVRRWCIWESYETGQWLFSDTYTAGRILWDEPSSEEFKIEFRMLQKVFKDNPSGYEQAFDDWMYEYIDEY